MGTAVPLLIATPLCVILHEALLAKRSRFFFGIAFAAESFTDVRSSFVHLFVCVRACVRCAFVYVRACACP